VITRGGLLAFPISDVVSPATAQPGVDSPLGFPVTVGGAFGVCFTTFSPFGGLAVDDDGSAYFAQADLIQRSGGNIVKVASLDSTTSQDRSLAVSGILTITTLNPAGGIYGSTSGPSDQVNRFTNYSGTSTLFGNVVALAAGPCNTVYAALAKSSTGTGDVTEGLFTAPAALSAVGTPSMVISFSDASGAFESCSGLPDFGIVGQIPIGNGFADPIVGGVVAVPGVNNFRAYVLGNGPDLRSGASPVFGSASETLKLDLQIDFTAHSGLVLDEAGKLFVISGGTPAATGLNPSPLVSEILWFSDTCPADRRADFVDFRGDLLPLPPASGGNVGDGDSDRFDHIFVQAAFDGITFTPTGLSGLARGFLLYLNRHRNDYATLAVLPNGGTQGDDSSTGPIVFEDLDPSHSVAGGDDLNTPFRGDDSDGQGNPVLTDLNDGGFEFTFGGPVGVSNCVWNGFYLNSNGSLTFGAGSADNTPSVLELRAGEPRIAAAWADLNPASRAGGALNTFPVQALGFADVNAFKVRWINVPEFGGELCGSSNTCSITLQDDGVLIDENSNQPLNPANPIGNNAVPFDLQEGPTDLVFERDPVTNRIVGCSSRREGSGQFWLDYCRMDLLGTLSRPVIAGFSLGYLAPTLPPGLCELNLSEAARTADTEPFAVIQDMTASVRACLIGEGTEPTLYEYFADGRDASIGVWGELIGSVVDFDLRDGGNAAALTKPVAQVDDNRERVCFLGVGCAPPANPNCLAVLPVLPIEVTPTTAPVGPDSIQGIVNALCDQEILIQGCGFYPDEITQICTADHGQRPGKTVTTAVTLSCDSDGNGIAEHVSTLVNVDPISDMLIRATLPTAPGLPGSPFGLACCGGPGWVTVTTTFSLGDNNVFGPFTRTTVCPVNLGVRAPVVLSVTPSGGDCSIPQDVLISGSCFIIPQGPISRVFAVEFDPDTQTLNYGNTVDAVNFFVLNTNLIDALFDLDGNPGKAFMIFVTGPGGTSRNLTAGQTPAGCVSGNEAGVQVMFTCDGENEAPVAICRNVTKTADGSGFAAVTAAEVDNGSFDPDGDTFSRVLSPAGPFPVGNTLVTLTVTDSHGASSSCQSTVTVNASNQAPVAICRNVTKTADGSGFATVTAAEVDNGSFDPDGDTFSRVLSPAGPFPVGNTLVTLTVTDSQGASSWCQSTVTVNAPATKPKVKVQVPDAAASEPGTNKGKFRLVRNSTSATPLTVFYTVSGSATSNVDYIPLSGSAVIPGGASFVDIVLSPKNDTAKEAVETVILTLSANAAYQIVTPSQGTVNIQDND
jgi:hypothetical protein